MKLCAGLAQGFLFSMENSKDEIRLEIELTGQDVRRTTMRNIRRVVLLAGVLAFVLIFVFFVVTSRFIIDNPPTYLRYVALATLIFGPLSLMLWIRYLFVRVSDKAAKRRLPETYLFRAEGINSEREGKSEKTAWSFYSKAVESRHEFRLVARDGSTVQIPKRCLASGEQIDELRRLIIQQMGQDAVVNE